MLPAGSLRQERKYCAAGETITGVGVYAVVGSHSAFPHRLSTEWSWAMSKLIRIVSAGSAVTSRLLGAAARGVPRRRLAPMVLVALLGTFLAVG